MNLNPDMALDRESWRVFAFDLAEAEAAIRSFLEHFPLSNNTKEHGARLAEVMARLRVELLNAFEGSPREPDSGEISSLAYSLRQDYTAFVAGFLTNLEALHCYLVPDFSLYSAYSLMEGQTLGSETLKRIPKESAVDFVEAGKCLALGLYTACGFHALRASEATMKRYMLGIGLTRAEIDGCKSWYDYANKIRSKNSLIAGAVENMRVAYRNPIMHPEDTLTLEQSDVLFQSCRSLIVIMAQQLTSKP